ncbi:efflux RND transporter periplasmic adaptor subunit [Janthinobacterium aquaticum]|jgi:membrane fusion protein, heavy metal efflux system|uniref:efflux RND transporter periplasmic adaptor subunit n=1 Tax=Janthinobacterium sp. FT58W TaxID=2654254 RepID=UPI001265244D|nr:efflux RND transporter periplasmic adaptor subunit [Janthinobacterium sp. FT58W]KAB8043161.1 efflux RND transporter periplasmic adaptor subunit [Janthinobacterium sp. FT58W]
MNFNTDKQSKKSALVIVLIGVVLAAAIMFWKKDSGGGAASEAPRAEEGKEGGHAEKEGDHAEKEGGKEEDHGEEGILKMDAQQIQTAGITVAKAAPASMGSVVQLPGEVRFNEDLTAHIVPRTPGVAESVSADLGQSVKKGQVLAVISSPALADMRSASLAAQKRLGLAQITFQREKKLWEDKISAEQDYLQAQAALREAEIEAQSAKSKLSALGAGDTDGAINRYVLRAPFNGVVVEKHIAQGEAVKEDANVFLLSDLSSVWVEIVVTPKDLETVRVGETVRITSAANDTSATGKVSYVGNLLGEQTRTAKARVVITNPKLAWRPGLFVNAAVVRGEKNVPVAVAADAVQTVEGKTVVFVKVDKGFKMQPVKTGDNDGKLVEIVDGLSAGAVYAATSSYVLKAEQGKGTAGHDH